MAHLEVAGGEMAHLEVAGGEMAHLEVVRGEMAVQERVGEDEATFEADAAVSSADVAHHPGNDDVTQRTQAGLSRVCNARVTS